MEGTGAVTLTGRRILLLGPHRGQGLLLLPAPGLFPDLTLLLPKGGVAPIRCVEDGHMVTD